MKGNSVGCGLVASSMLVLVALAVAMPVLAAPPDPHVFYGTVTAAGQYVAVGTSVTAEWEENPGIWTQCGASQTTWNNGSTYTFGVRGDDSVTTELEEGPVNGDLVRFKVAGEVSGTGVWQSGQTTNLPLNRPGALATVTPTPEATSTPTLSPTPTPTNTLTPTNTPTVTDTPDRPPPTPTPTLAPGQERIVLQNGLEVALESGGAGLWNGTDVYEGTIDTHLHSWYPEVNSNGEGRLAIRDSAVAKPILRFDLSPVPDVALTVEYAMLDLFTADWGGTNPLAVGTYRVLADWDVDTATWLSASAGVAWTGEGCSSVGNDVVWEASDTQIVDYVGYRYTWDVTEMVQTWHDDPETNKGVILVADAGAMVQFNFASEEYVHQPWRPRLSVTFVRGTPEPTLTHTPEMSPTPTATHTTGPSPTATGMVSPTPTLPPGGVIEGIVWHDWNVNQEIDPGEPPVAGATITLLDGWNSELDTYLTLADGVFRFVGLSAGQYTVTALPPAGYWLTTPGAAVVFVEAQGVVRMRFGVLQAATSTPWPPAPASVLPLVMK